MRWKISRKVAQLVWDNNLVEIKKILDPYSLDQRRCITSVKFGYTTLLFIAVENEHISIVNYFLESCGADPNATGYIEGKDITCLAEAVRKNSEAIVSILLRHGADIEAVSFGRQTAFYFACKHERLEIAKLLIEHGADVNCYTTCGDSSLMRSMFDLELFQHLISRGANINFMNADGHTSLMLALTTERNEIVSLLLNYENTDVRLKNCFEEDALHEAVRITSLKFIETIVKKGNYTNYEVIMVRQMERCLAYIRNKSDKEKEMWNRALRLKFQSNDTPMFRNRHSAGKLQEIADDFNADDVPALLYFQSMIGLNNIFTLTAYIAAAKNVTDSGKYIRLGEFFFKTLHSSDNSNFFSAYRIVDVFIQHYFIRYCQRKTSEILQIFELFVAYIEDVRARLERMSPQERTSHAHKVECFLYNVIDLLIDIYDNCSDEMNLFYEGTQRILKADLRNLGQETLTQLCVNMCAGFPVINHIISCGADVNSTDNEGKTVLHEAVECPMKIKDDIVEIIIGKGFNFNEIKYDKYCLPCMLEKQYILPTPAKHISLQCLATRAFCEKTLTSFSDVPSSFNGNRKFTPVCSINNKVDTSFLLVRNNLI